VSKRSAIIGLVAVAAVTAFFARDRLFPRKLPALVLETSQGGTVALRDTGGKEYGVILYFSSVPGDQHAALFPHAVGTYKAMQASARYHVLVVFGASDLQVARDFAAKVDIPVVLDPGKELARRLGFTYLGIVFYRPSGKIVKKVAEASLMRVIDLDDHLDVLRGR